MKPLTLDARIGVVGVGRMGANMARRLHEVGFAITAIYDVNREAADLLATELTTVAVAQLAAVTQHSDVIITVVTDDAAMQQIYTHPDDNLLQQAEGKLFLNCATITPLVHKAIRDACDAIGAEVLECPMASSIPQARSGELYLMCAGKKAVYDAAQPVLTALAAQRIYTGEVTTAAQIKALVNMVMNINTAGLAEGLGLADALGLDLDLVRQIFSQTGANSRVLQTDGDDMVQREHDAYFSAAHAAKDSGIALKLGQAAGLPMVLADATKRQYDALVTHGLGHLDKSAVAELTFLERLPAALR